MPPFPTQPTHLLHQIMQSYPNCLILRLRMPVSDDLHPRSFVTKITRYAHVVDIPNSTTMLHDLVPVAVALAEHGETGVYNFCNPGAISHNEVLGLYRDIVDPAVVKAGRSNCELDPEKLVRKCREFGIRVPEVKEAYRACFERMKRGMEMQQKAGAQGL
ncbi:hypothetical protein H2203_004612 [Taxawa tesnikishii (nom. ined.)]|nr:hypothetical protein H2203_004612 [Dothideales sp. JES 119]